MPGYTLMLLLMASTIMSGCTTIQQYHPYVKGDCPALQQALYDGEKFIERGCSEVTPPAQDQAAFSYGFVELDEYGNLLQKSAFTQLMTELRQLPSDVLTVVYIHGWNHSADDNDADVNEFKQAMRNIAFMDDKRHRNVVGIYVGWRGLVSSVQPLKLLSFWDRKSTAHMVGDGAVTEILVRLDKENTRRNGNQDGPNRLVFVGHSFGAAVLYSALSPILVERFIQSPEFDSSASLAETGCVDKTPIQPKTIGNMVVLINPAFEAMRFSTLHKLSQDCRYRPTQLPLIAVVTGYTDHATGWAFPIARFFRTIFQKYADYDKYSDTKQEQFSANTLALGHYEPYITHYLRSDTVGLRSASTDTFKGCENFRKPVGQKLLFEISGGATQTFTQTDPGAKALSESFTLTLTRNAKFFYPKHNPVINVLASKEIINGHGGIYSCQLMKFIGGLISQEIQPELTANPQATSQKAPL